MHEVLEPNHTAPARAGVQHWEKLLHVGGAEKNGPNTQVFHIPREEMDFNA